MFWLLSARLSVYVHSLHSACASGKSCFGAALS